MKKPGIGVKIVKLVFRLLVVFAIMAGIAFASFQGVSYYLTGSFAELKEATQDTKDVLEDHASADEGSQAVIDETNLESTLLIVDGKDQRTEYIYVNLYNKESGKLDVILVPANARVSLGKDNLKKVQEKIKDAGEDQEIQDIAAAFGEDKYGILRSVFAEVTGLTINGCDSMSLDAFQEVLETGPKVTYNMPSLMSYRNMDSELKSIDAGDQELDGEKGVALITHLDGTGNEESSRLDRTSTYIGSFLGQLTKSRKASDVVACYEKNALMDRDEGMTSVQDLVDGLDADDITIRIMQGGEEDGLFLLDSQKIQLQIAALAKQTQDGTSAKKDKKDDKDDKEDNDAVYSDQGGESKELAIEIFNAAYVEGLARRWEDYLTSEGYNISMIDSYQQDGVFSETRIRVTEEGMGEDLLDYFPDAEIYVDEISTGGDIRIYLGSDSTNVPEITNSTEDSESPYYNEEDSEDSE